MRKKYFYILGLCIFLLISYVTTGMTYTKYEGGKDLQGYITDSGSFALYDGFYFGWCEVYTEVYGGDPLWRPLSAVASIQFNNDGTITASSYGFDSSSWDYDVEVASNSTSCNWSWMIDTRYNTGYGWADLYWEWED